MTKTFPLFLSLAFTLLARSAGIERAARAADGATSFQKATRDDARAFSAIMTGTMAHMHQGMSVPETGEPDRDFAAMMIPHHQGAVDMAIAELRFGHDPRLRRLAEGIIVEQRQEIDVMKGILANAR